MAKYKIIFDRETCIGALSCNVVAPEFWKLAHDGKVDLEGAIFNKETGKYELIIDEKYLVENKEAARVCPVLVIEIYNLETGEKII